MLQTIGIILVLALFMFLCLKGYNTIVCAILCSILAIAVTGQPMVATWTGSFLVGAGDTVKALAGNFLAGSFFGKMYQESGAATSIARMFIRIVRGKNDHLNPVVAILAIYVPCLILGFGGITGAPITFILVPIALEILKEARVPKEMAPAVVLGVVLTSLQCMPGAPQLNNVLCMDLLGTSSTASMIIGIITGVFILAINTGYIAVVTKRYHRLNPGADLGYEKLGSNADKRLPNPIISLIPLIFVFVAFNVFKLFITYTLLLGALISGLMFSVMKSIELKKIPDILGNAAMTIAPTIIICATVAGLGYIITGSETFNVMTNALLGLSGPPIFTVALVIGLVACICGNGLTALQTVIPAFKDTFVAAGVKLPALHRVACYSSVTLDSLPTSSMVILTSQLCGEPLSRCYKHIFMTTVINTSLGTFLCCVLTTLFPNWP